MSNGFRDRIISSGIWPAHLSDVNPSNFSFWGYLKDKVYNNNLQMKTLKENIRREIANIPAKELQRVNQNLLCQCEEC
jgi:hypothetical protein